MKKEDIDEIKFLSKLADAQMYQIFEFDDDMIVRNICKDAIKTYDNIISILKKYTVNKDKEICL